MTLEQDNNIDFFIILKKIWNSRRSIISIALISFLVGCFIAIFSETRFTARSVFIPQLSGDRQAPGDLGGLASLAGINLIGGLQSEILPDLYPKYVSSVNYRLALLEAPISVAGRKDKVTYREYFEEIYSPGLFKKISKYTIGLPALILNEIRGEKLNESTSDSSSTFISLTDTEYGHLKRLLTQISVEPDDKKGTVELNFTMPTPLMAAEMARFSQQLLQKMVIQYKIENASKELRFTEGRYIEKKTEFEQIQLRLSIYKDRNQSIFTAKARNELEALETEYTLGFNIYNELAKQLEQAKLQVAKDTPIFSDLQQVIVPPKRSGPKRVLIIVVIVFLGLFIGIINSLLKDDLLKWKAEWRQR